MKWYSIFSLKITDFTDPILFVDYLSLSAAAYFTAATPE